jgi:hypothetical protein
MDITSVVCCLAVLINSFGLSTADKGDVVSAIARASDGQNLFIYFQYKRKHVGVKKNWLYFFYRKIIGKFLSSMID